MGFNELNAVENYIIHQLSGVNLNDSKAREPKSGYGAYRKYKTASELNRSVVIPLPKLA